MSGFPQHLESATVDIQVDERWCIRARKLTTADAARAGVLVELLAALTMTKDRKGAVGGMSPERAAQADQMVSRMLCDVVEAGSLDGGEFEDLRLVPTRAQHDPNATPPRLWVGVIPGLQRGAVAGAALALHAEAEGILRPFRSKQGHAAAAAQGRERVQQDAARDGGAHA